MKNVIEEKLFEILKSITCGIYFYPNCTEHSHP